MTEQAFNNLQLCCLFQGSVLEIWLEGGELVLKLGNNVVQTGEVRNNVNY